MKFILTAVFALALTAPFGCAVRPAAVENPTTIPRELYPQAFESAVQTLRDEGFTINRMDYRFGRINTHPRAAPTVFEPFRPTYGTPASALESTFNDQRRIVNVFFDPPEPAQPDEADPPPPRRLRLRVEVVVERRQVPGRQLTGAAQGFRVLADLDQTPAELVDRGIEGPYWHAVRRDVAMDQLRERGRSLFR